MKTASPYLENLLAISEKAFDAGIDEKFGGELMSKLASVEIAKCKAILGMQLDVDRFGQTWDRANLNAKQILARSAKLELDITLLPWNEVPYAKKLVLKGAAKRFKADFQEIIRSITP
ncbi:hypothetical protein [Polynucleobacter paneuropaeus]|uniref:hypothetical protein n=1 Tax=Polynucleobacter paneuropaeus TaxID=2527775 RepID=UPI001BFEBFFE|nr:hypothetical protein [Polynucleobacter paneuropaeus]QWD55213.1 hypothetical protein C2750_05610 [Polynucleobacter paneuropaeus]